MCVAISTLMDIMPGCKSFQTGKNNQTLRHYPGQSVDWRNDRVNMTLSIFISYIIRGNKNTIIMHREVS